MEDKQLAEADDVHHVHEARVIRLNQT